MTGPVPVQHLPLLIRPDPGRTVVRPFEPSDPPAYAVEGHPRGERIIQRLLALDEARLHAELVRIRKSLDDRHRDVEAMLENRFAAVSALVPAGVSPTREQRLLIGAYFSAEYAYESAALFNPSIVPHPDQHGLEPGDLRFVLSLRGIGEGHLSSVAFRSGVWASDGTVTINAPSRFAVPPSAIKPTDWQEGDTFELDCTGSHDVSETVLFPFVASQIRGIEDLRLTPFEYADGTRTYAGTYTALGESGIRQEILETADFHRFTMRSVEGALASEKGMALFPRPVGGRYLAIGRQDGENLWLFSSPDTISWRDKIKLLEPKAEWEFVQIGNCGSPIEINEGWLLLTHGVGEVRNYCIGAALLDRDEPMKVLGRLVMPLLEPQTDARDGYVPNVVYSCGALIRNRSLLLPYGVADNYTRFAAIEVDDLIAAMQ